MLNFKFAYENFVEPVKNTIVAESFYQISVGLEMASNLQNATFIYHDILMQMKALQNDIAEILLTTRYQTTSFRKTSS